jgi:hypothetical protein
MPWHIEEGNEKCLGFAVVKDEDGELEGCHRSRAQAERQLAALYASEQEDEDDLEDDDLSLQNERAGEGPRAQLVDIDGTLITDGGDVNGELIRRLNASDSVVIVVTGRVDAQQDGTVALLERISLDYDLLRMNPGGDPNSFKAETAKTLMANYDIVGAVDDNPRARQLYEELGIPTEAPAFRRAIAEEILAKLRNR